MFTTCTKVDLALLSPNGLRRALDDSITSLSDNISQYCVRPGRDFSRNTLLGLNGLVQQLIVMGAKDTRGEIADCVPLNNRVYSDSAITMARKKLKVEGMDFLFHHFTRKLDHAVTIKGYHLSDVDGTDLDIYLNPSDLETFIAQKDKSGYNQLHINVIFNPLNHIVQDIDIDTKHKSHEAESFLDMFLKWDEERKRWTIFIGDRGYPSYKLLYELQEAGAKYCFRIKDQNGKSLLSRIGLPEGEFDKTVTRILTRKHNKEYLEDRETYAVLETNVKFQFPEGMDEYPLTFRVVRFKLSTGEYETLITNLTEEEFSTLDMKALYRLRWSIEGNNKEVKHDINLVNLHSRKQSYIRQEIYARYILLNFTNALVSASAHFLMRMNSAERGKSEIVNPLIDLVLSGEDIPPVNEVPSFAQYSDEPFITGTRTRTKEELPVYKIDFSTAASTAKKFLLDGNATDTQCVMRIIKFLVLVQPGRSNIRNMKPQSCKGFTYRGA